jgi:hypothetical protein
MPLAYDRFTHGRLPPTNQTSYRPQNHSFVARLRQQQQQQLLLQVYEHIVIDADL